MICLISIRYFSARIAQFFNQESNNMERKNTKRFSLFNTAEGWSFIILLFIAMPMKYMMGMPVAVKIVGMIHGLLFIGFCVYLVLAYHEAKFSQKESIIFFIASLIPFGTFFTHKKINAYASNS